MDMNVYKNDSHSSVYNGAAWVGASILSVGNYIYFNASTFTDYPLYKYDTAGGGASSEVLNYEYSYAFAGYGNGIYFSAGNSSYSGTTLYYCPVGIGGNLGAAVAISEEFAGASGPVAFDAAGNLYYGSGVGSEVYKFSAADVSAAVAGTVMDDLASYLYFDAVSYGYAGATGMDVDADGNLVVSLTSWGGDSVLVSYDGTDSSIIASSDSRISRVVNRNGQLFFNDAEGIYQVVPEPVSVLLILCGALGVAGYRRMFANV
ncbi:MAG: hypothetical protein WC959_04995 [Kiritimatiellales bacterium]